MLIKLLRKETRKLSKAFFNPTFLYLTLVGNSILLVAATAVYYLERDVNPQIKTFFDSLWWGICTITTIGYGDVLPITVAGRLINIVLIYSGTVLFITFTGVILTFMMQEEVEKELKPIEKKVHREERETDLIEKELKGIRARLERLEKSEPAAPLPPQHDGKAGKAMAAAKPKTP